MGAALARRLAAVLSDRRTARAGCPAASVVPRHRIAGGVDRGRRVRRRRRHSTWQRRRAAWSPSASGACDPDGLDVTTRARNDGETDARRDRRGASDPRRGCASHPRSPTRGCAWKCREGRNSPTWTTTGRRPAFGCRGPGTRAIAGTESTGRCLRASQAHRTAGSRASRSKGPALTAIVSWSGLDHALLWEELAQSLEDPWNGDVSPSASNRRPPRTARAPAHGGALTLAPGDEITWSVALRIAATRSDRDKEDA